MPFLRYYLKVDCGNKRAGVRSEDAEAVNIVAFIHQHPRQVWGVVIIKFIELLLENYSLAVFNCGR